MTNSLQPEGYCTSFDTPLFVITLWFPQSLLVLLSNFPLPFCKFVPDAIAVEYILSANFVLLHDFRSL